MLSYNEYTVGNNDIDIWECIEQYIVDRKIDSPHVILHCACGEPKSFFKVYVDIVNNKPIRDRYLGVCNCALYVFGYTLLEEVPITHCELQGKGVEQC